MWFEIPLSAHAKGISRPGLDLIQQSFYKGAGGAVGPGLQELRGCDSPSPGQAPHNPLVNRRGWPGSSGLLVKPSFFYFLQHQSCRRWGGAFMGRDVCDNCGFCPNFCMRNRHSGVQDQAPGVTVLLQVS